MMAFGSTLIPDFPPYFAKTLPIGSHGRPRYNHHVYSRVYASSWVGVAGGDEVATEVAVAGVTAVAGVAGMAGMAGSCGGWGIWYGWDG